MGRPEQSEGIALADNVAHFTPGKGQPPQTKFSMWLKRQELIVYKGGISRGLGLRAKATGKERVARRRWCLVRRGWSPAPSFTTSPGGACVLRVIQREIRKAGGWADSTWWAAGGRGAFWALGRVGSWAILAHRRTGPQGCRYGGNRRLKEHIVGLGRGRWASLLHTADLSLGNRAWLCI